MKTLRRTALALLLVAALAALTACGGTQNNKSSEVGSGAIEPLIDSTKAVTTTKFIPYPDYSEKVEDEEDAEKALYSMMDSLGGDETVELVFHDAFGNAEDTVYYSFEQALGGVRIFSGGAKLIVDKDGKVLGVSSTIVTGIEEAPAAAWEITQQEAEHIVAEGHLDPGEKLLPEATEQTILMLPDKTFLYVWVVYSTNLAEGADKAYLAHYVTGAGEYLYDIPISTPGNEDALNGAVAEFAFEGYEEGTWTGEVTDVDGPVRKIEVPLMIDQETGKQILGDKERRILCADCSDFIYRDTLTPITSTDGSWVNNELITYEKMIRIWDFFTNLGWRGPDGDGTPMLLLLNLCDENGEPEDNAAYSGKYGGFQIFKVNDAFGDGSCTDIMAHEYTHCITGTSRIHDVYLNDMGAINEGLSDIFGNLVEMAFGDSPDGAWVFSERHSNGAIRSMKDPHEFDQPEYTWDVSYLPNADWSTDGNDGGGVHYNCSLVSMISYKLDQAGMTPEEQLYYWMNVDFAQTSRISYPILSEVLPFVMEITGYSKYEDALKQAIRDVKLDDKEVPEQVAPDQALATFELPFDPVAQECEVAAAFYNLETEKSYRSWPVEDTRQVAAVIPPGDYIITVTLANADKPDLITALFVATKDGWRLSDGTIQDLREADEEGRKLMAIHFDGGEVKQLETESMAERLVESDK